MAVSTGVANLRRSGVAGDPLWSPAILPLLWTGALALAVQLLLIKVVAPETGQSTWMVWAVFFSHLLVLPFLVRNARYLGIKLVLVGLSLNLLVMAANSGGMPVSAAGIEAAGKQASIEPGDHVVGSKDFYAIDPRLPQLSDKIVVRLPGHLARVVSVGDVVIALGTMCTIASLSLKLIGAPAKRTEAV